LQQARFFWKPRRGGDQAVRRSDDDGPLRAGR
jgi:hypothetical protein